MRFKRPLLARSMTAASPKLTVVTALFFCRGLFFPTLPGAATLVNKEKMIFPLSTKRDAQMKQMEILSRIVY